MNVTCPGCSTRYALPQQLLGPSGARVCCPACWLTFVLGPAGELAAVLGHGEAAGSAGEEHANGQVAPAHEPGAGLEPGVAGEGATPMSRKGDDPVLDVVLALDEPPGMLAAAAARGTLFTEHGEALATAFEALEVELPDLDVAAAFRSALHEVAGVDLAVQVSGTELSSLGKV